MQRVKQFLMETEVQHSALMYVKAKSFMDIAKKHQSEITMRELKSLRSQALKGDVEGAIRGLQSIIDNKRLNGRL